MPFVAPLTKEQAPAAAQPVLDEIEQALGQSLNIFNTMAYQPEVLQGAAAINSGIGNDLPGKFRELAYLKSSAVNECGYCTHYHRMLGKKAGVSGAQIEALDNYADSDAFDDQEKAVLAYAEQLTRNADVQHQTVEKIKAFLDDKQLVTLAATVALANFTNRFNHGLGIELP